MSKISKHEVGKIATLARLDFGEADLERFVPSFQQILDYFEQLEAIDTGDVEPTYHTLEGQPLETPLQPDECGESLERDQVMSQAPQERNGQFRVPKVIE